MACFLRCPVSLLARTTPGRLPRWVTPVDQKAGRESAAQLPRRTARNVRSRNARHRPGRVGRPTTKESVLPLVTSVANGIKTGAIARCMAMAVSARAVVVRSLPMATPMRRSAEVKREIHARIHACPAMPERDNREMPSRATAASSSARRGFKRRSAFAGTVRARHWRQSPLRADRHPSLRTPASANHSRGPLPCATALQKPRRWSAITRH